MPKFFSKRFKRRSIDNKVDTSLQLEEDDNKVPSCVKSSLSTGSNGYLDDPTPRSDVPVPYNAAEGPSRNGDLSYSIASSGSRASTISFGTTYHEDSFAAISNTGLSSAESSINSDYLYTRTRARRNGSSNDEDEKDSNLLRVKTTTNVLPRLTVNTKQTMALLPSDDVDKMAAETSITPRTAATVPETPVPASIDDDGEKFPDRNESNEYSPDSDNRNEEFPVNNDINFSPKIHMHTDKKSLPQSQMPSDLPRKLQMSHEISIYSTSMTRDQGSTSFSTSYERRRQVKKDHDSRNAAHAEMEYWDMQLKEIAIEYGMNSVQAARGLGNLGASLLRCKKFPEALSAYKRTVGILRVHYGEDSLIVARALDKIGLSASLCATPENLEWALIALKEALHIRISYLGPHHCDCADTLNNIAGVCLQKKEWLNARSLYLDVLAIRAAIFGKNHVSIAITAQTLGKIFHHLSDFNNALLHYNLAMSTYRGEPMNLKANHPIIQKLLKAISATERLAMVKM